MYFSCRLPTLLLIVLLASLSRLVGGWMDDVPDHEDEHRHEGDCVSCKNAPHTDSDELAGFSHVGDAVLYLVEREVREYEDDQDS